MLGLEDIFETIEDLPGDLMDMLTSIRELDLVVENAMDEKAKETEEFFSCAKDMQPPKRESVFQSLMSDFGKILEDANEKVIIAEKLDKLMVDCIMQLDRQIAEVKIGLEADNPGVTATIEAKVAKSGDRTGKGAKTTKTEKRKRPTRRRKKSSSSSSTVSSVDEMPAARVKQEEAAVNNVTVALKVEATVLPETEQLIYDATKYCFCNDVSYGDMIACDNQSCPHEWFHYACVNLTVAPEGAWYCPKCRPKECSVSLKKCLVGKLR